MHILGVQLRSGRSPLMHSIFRSIRRVRGVASLGFALAAAGCSYGGGSTIAQVPIRVSLPISPRRVFLRHGSHVMQIRL